MSGPPKAMPSIGPFANSIRIDGAGRAPGLVAGAFVSVRVVELVEPGLYRVSVGGKLLLARSEAPLTPGASFRARVERGAGGGPGSAPAGYVLRPAEGRASASAEAAIVRAGLPDDLASRTALLALLREGAAPEPRSLARVRRAVLRDLEAGGCGSGAAEEEGVLAARLEGKGIEATEDRVAAIAAGPRNWPGGAGGEGGRGRNGPDGSGRGAPGPEGGDRAGGPSEAPRLDPAADLEAAIPEDELPAVLGRFLLALAERAGPGGEFLQLFNHVRGEDGTWVHVPFAFDLDSVAFAGSFRLHLPCLPGGPGRIEARFEAIRGSRSVPWAFDVDFGGRSPALRIRSEDPAAEDAARASIGALRDLLSGSGLSPFAGKPREAGAAGLDLDA